MNIILLILIVGIISAGILFPNNSFAQSPIGTLNIEKKTYEIPFNEQVSVKISGNIKSYAGTNMVTISIVDPDNFSDGTKIVPFPNGNFEFVIDFNRDDLKGTYIVIASFNGQIFEKTSFEIKDKTPSIEDILRERGEKITKQEETPIEPEPVKEIPKDIPQVDNQKPVPNFADPAVDPQYYLDRYYNEDNYKAWFDKNYPDYTIEQAVGFMPKN